LNATEDQLLRDTVSGNTLPGIAAVTTDINSTAAYGVAGVRKYGDPTPMTAQDVFHLGSNTKAMTSTLLGWIIANTGSMNVSWNAPLSRALPAFKDMHPDFENVTIAMLGSHRSGISKDVPERDIPLMQSLLNTTMSPVEGRRRVAEKFLREAPDVAPNTTFAYSNVNYILLGYFIDTLGAPYEERMQKDLWEALGMNDCGFGPTPESTATSIEQPWAHRAGPQNPVPVSSKSNSTIDPADNPPTYNSAGRAHCSLESYAEFLIFHLGVGNGRTSAHLSIIDMDKLHTPHFYKKEEKPANVFTPGGWIYGEKGSTYGEGSLSHAGSNTLNYALAVVAPGRDVAVAALTNYGGDGGAKGVTEVVNELLRAYPEQKSEMSKISMGGLLLAVTVLLTSAFMF
jgi:D-alanyl-D-alanine carboxypeptidase